MDKKLTIKVHATKNFTAAQLEKYVEAVEKTEQVLNSQEFHDELLKLKLTSTKGLSNQQIYEMIINGAEVLDPIIDNEVDIFISMYYKNNKVVGYTYSSVKETWLNSKFFKSSDSADIACNLTHEWLHKLGFGHKSAKEKTSVPYAVGYLVERLVRKLT